MPSTYSSNLALELIATGEQAGSWGTTTNTNFGTLVEQAISGYTTQAITDGADTVITIPNGATGVARNMSIECTGALTANRNLLVPANRKLYFIYNNTTGGYAVTIKVSGQTGVSVPNGKKMLLVCNGTDVVNAINYFSSLEVAAAVLTATDLTVSGTAVFDSTVDIGASEPVTAAATTDLGALTSVRVVVSGTTTITSFGTASEGVIKVLKFASATPITYNATSMILPGGASMVMAVGDVMGVVSKGSGNWEFLWYTPNYVFQSAIQDQTFTAYTTGGTSTAYTLTPTPATTANSTKQRFNITLHTAPGASPTLAVSGQTAKNLKYYDSAGAKQFITSSVTPSGWITDVIYDGTDWVVQRILPPSALATNLSGGSAGSVPYQSSANNTTMLSIGTVGRNLVSTGSAPSWGSAITLASEVTTTSGTTASIPNIPSWVNQVTFMINEVSTNGTSPLRIRLGDSGGVETTVDLSGSGILYTNGANAGDISTAGFDFSGANGATVTWAGAVTFTRFKSGAETWICSGNIGAAGSIQAWVGIAGKKITSAALTTIQLTTVNGTDTFDGGSIGAAWL